MQQRESSRLVKAALHDLQGMLDFHARNMTDGEWIMLLAELRDEISGRQVVVRTALADRPSTQED